MKFFACGLGLLRRKGEEPPVDLADALPDAPPLVARRPGRRDEPPLLLDKRLGLAAAANALRKQAVGVAAPIADRPLRGREVRGSRGESFER